MQSLSGKILLILFHMTQWHQMLSIVAFCIFKVKLIQASDNWDNHIHVLGNHPVKIQAFLDLRCTKKNMLKQKPRKLRLLSNTKREDNKIAL